MNEVYLCRACSRSTRTLPAVCTICGACSWNILKEKLTDMPWYSMAAKLRIMTRMARAQAAKDDQSRVAAAFTEQRRSIQRGGVHLSDEPLRSRGER